MVKSFENFLFEQKTADDVYRKSVNDEYWKEAYAKFPNSNSDQAEPAAKFILDKMKEKYPDENWKEIEDSVYRKIFDGLT